ncbi:MAG: ABC transporter ATP-binding protein [Mycobacteriales bacterium]|nr:ABC transporter ATP-binding protein [Mycobacteriales bacterium]
MSDGLRERVLEVKDLKVSFGKAQVLDGVSFHVDRGETVAVVGPNGAGKTTLLRALSRLNTCTGSVEFDGRPLAKRPYDVVMSGLVHTPERRRLFPGLTIRDNLELGARRLRKQPNTRAEDLERVYALFPKLKERAGQTAGTLSGGEQQQCAIGRSLMGRPTLLLLDEPTLGLSVGVKEAIIAGIQSIQESGTTMLLVEQDVSFAFRCAERVIVLEHGRVAREGPTAQIAADPYVKQAYLGVA